MAMKLQNKITLFLLVAGTISLLANEPSIFDLNNEIKNQFALYEKDLKKYNSNIYKLCNVISRDPGCYRLLADEIDNGFGELDWMASIIEKNRIYYLYKEGELGTDWEQKYKKLDADCAIKEAARVICREMPATYKFKNIFSKY